MIRIHRQVILRLEFRCHRRIRSANCICMTLPASITPVAIHILNAGSARLWRIHRQFMSFTLRPAKGVAPCIFRSVNLEFQTHRIRIYCYAMRNALKICRYSFIIIQLYGCGCTVWLCYIPRPVQKAVALGWYCGN